MKQFIAESIVGKRMGNQTMKLWQFPVVGLGLATALALQSMSCREVVAPTQPEGQIVVIGNGIEIAWDRALVANAGLSETPMKRSFLLADDGAVAIGDLAKDQDLATEEVSWVKSVSDTRALVKLLSDPSAVSDVSGKCLLVEAQQSNLTCYDQFTISDSLPPELMTDGTYVFLDGDDSLRRGPLQVDSSIIAQEVDDFFVRSEGDIVYRRKSGQWFVVPNQLSLEKSGRVDETERQLNDESQSNLKEPSAANLVSSALMPIPNPDMAPVYRFDDGRLIKLSQTADPKSSVFQEKDRSSMTDLSAPGAYYQWLEWSFEKRQWKPTWSYALRLPYFDASKVLLRGDQLIVSVGNDLYSLRHEGAFLLPLAESLVRRNTSVEISGVAGRLLFRERKREADETVGQLCQYAYFVAKDEFSSDLAGYQCRTLKLREADLVTASLLTEDFLVIALGAKVSESGQPLNQVIALPSHKDHQYFAQIVKRWEIKGQPVDSLRFFQSATPQLLEREAPFTQSP